MEFKQAVVRSFGILKKIKDADAADSRRASLDAAKKQDIVKQDFVTDNLGEPQAGRGCGEGGGRHTDGDHRDEFSAG